MSSTHPPTPGDDGLAGAYPKPKPPTHGRLSVLSLVGTAGSLGISEALRMFWPDHLVGVIGEQATPYAVISVLIAAAWVGGPELRYGLNILFPRVQVNYYDYRGTGGQTQPPSTPEGGPSNPENGPSSGPGHQG